MSQRKFFKNQHYQTTASENKVNTLSTDNNNQVIKLICTNVSGSLWDAFQPGSLWNCTINLHVGDLADDECLTSSQFNIKNIKTHSMNLNHICLENEFVNYKWFRRQFNDLLDNIITTQFPNHYKDGNIAVSCGEDAFNINKIIEKFLTEIKKQGYSFEQDKLTTEGSIHFPLIIDDESRISRFRKWLASTEGKIQTNALSTTLKLK